MSEALAIAGAVVIVVGTLFSVVGVLGLYRLPDVYSRLHATGKISVFAVTILLIGAKVIGVAALGKALVLVAFLVLAGPALSHAIAIAAWRSGVPMKGDHPGPPRL